MLHGWVEAQFGCERVRAKASPTLLRLTAWQIFETQTEF